MFVTKRAIPRRTFLRGTGTVLALPFLESMVPAFTALAQTPARPPLRFGAVYIPNGAPMKEWMPRAAGALEVTPILKPLEAYRDSITVVGNLSRAGGKTVTDHAVSSASRSRRKRKTSNWVSRSTRCSRGRSGRRRRSPRSNSPPRISPDTSAGASRGTAART